MSFGSLLGAVLLRDFSGQHGFSHLLFCMVVVRADVFILQEREQFIFVTLQSLNEPFGIFVLMVFLQELLKAMVESSLAASKGFELVRIFSLKESDGIFEQACQLFAKGLPLRGSIVFVHLGKFGEQGR